MSEAKFTSYPWSIDMGEARAGEYCLITAIHNGEKVGVAAICWEDDFLQESELDASLIAAAPEMYKALELAETWLYGWGSAEQYLSIISDVLAKARGES